MVATVQVAIREPSKGLGAERALPESDIHRVVETLHPDDHGRPAPPARPPFRQAVQARPERPPETDSERHPNSSHVSGEAEPTRIAGVRRDLALPQRQRNPVILDKGAGWHQASNVGGFRNPLPVLRRVAAMKKKERPPKDDRPKEKRFRHGGRKGRRAARRRDEAKRP